MTPAAIWRCSVVSAPMGCKVVHRGRDSTFEFYLTWVGQGGGGLGRATGVGTRGSTAVGVLETRAVSLVSRGQPTATTALGAAATPRPAWAVSHSAADHPIAIQSRPHLTPMRMPTRSNSAPTTSRLRDKPAMLTRAPSCQPKEKETTSGEPRPRAGVQVPAKEPTRRGEVCEGRG